MARARRAKRSYKGLIFLAIILIVGICIYSICKNKFDVKEKNKESNTENSENIVENFDQMIENNDVVNEDFSQNKESKAIDIVKNDWGNDDSVYFKNMGIDNSGRYIVTVNKSSTSEIIIWYYIDIVSGKINKQH